MPYTASSSGYPEAQRCDILNGCPSLTPARSTVDKIAVQIQYRHTPVTPLRELMRIFGGDGTLGLQLDVYKAQRLAHRADPVSQHRA